MEETNVILRVCYWSTAPEDCTDGINQVASAYS